MGSFIVKQMSKTQLKMLFIGIMILYKYKCNQLLLKFIPPTLLNIEQNRGIKKKNNSAAMNF